MPRGVRTPITPEGVAEHPACDCHGLLMLWQSDKRRSPGGYWYCADRRRVYNQTRHDQRVAWETARRNRDPLHRIRSDLAHRRREGLRRIAAREPSEEGSTSSPGTEPRIL